MAKEQSQLDRTETARKTRALFTGIGPASGQVEQLLEMQCCMLKEARLFTLHWFERRQKATEAAVEALHKMKATGSVDPAAAMQAMADWQRGSFERMTADLMEWTALCMRGVDASTTVRLPGSAVDKDAKDAGTSRGKPASSRKSSDAMPV
ncbi:hypothetical protein [Paracoccus salsus]|uniref:hypothetical protein n=1 Tax=Paracoccus salsus TaxID=2911061 RepID=UPI001F229068|nr:hypothetical protein [Paracoccus salsus]MCF3974684.1 hypothetical protein [Paracoccus salsus]